MTPHNPIERKAVFGSQGAYEPVSVWPYCLLFVLIAAFITFGPLVLLFVLTTTP